MVMDDEAEIDQTYAQGILKHVIDNVSGNEESEDFNENVFSDDSER